MLNLQLSHYFLQSFLRIYGVYPSFIRCGPSLIDVIKIDRSEWEVSGRDDDNDRVIRAHTFHICVSRTHCRNKDYYALGKAEVSLEKAERDRARVSKSRTMAPLSSYSDLDS